MEVNPYQTPKEIEVVRKDVSWLNSAFFLYAVTSWIYFCFEDKSVIGFVFSVCLNLVGLYLFALRLQCGFNFTSELKIAEKDHETTRTV